jgi:hypothetical protein
VVSRIAGERICRHLCAWSTSEHDVNLSTSTPLWISPVSLALGANTIAMAPARQRQSIDRPRTGGPRMRAAVATGVGLPEITAELIASLGEHRVLSTEQLRTIHLPGRSLRRTQQVLASLEGAGLLSHVDARVAPRRLWFLSEAGADLAVDAGGLDRRPKVLEPRDAAGALRAHTLAVNRAAICSSVRHASAAMSSARFRGDTRSRIL